MIQMKIHGDGLLRKKDILFLMIKGQILMFGKKHIMFTDCERGDEYEKVICIF